MGPVEQEIAAALRVGSIFDDAGHGADLLGGKLVGPSLEAQGKYAGLKAAWISYEQQGVANYQDLAPDLVAWRAFSAAWEANDIAASDIAGRLNAEIVRSNRVQASLREKLTNKPAFVQDNPSNITNLPLENATWFNGAASSVDDWAQKHVDWLTSPTLSPTDIVKRLAFTAAAVAAGAVVASVAVNAVITGAMRR